MDPRSNEFDEERPRQTSGFREALLRDLQHMVPRAPGRPTWQWWLETAFRLALVPRIRAVLLYRVSQVAARHGLAPLALALQARGLRASGAEISPSSSIGPGLCLMHSSGVVIGPQVSIGKGARIYQGVTLGDGARAGQPRIGDHVTIGAGASVLGPVRVGDRVTIGAGALITEDLHDDAVALGAKATSARTRRSGVDPRLDALMAGELDGSG